MGAYGNDAYILANRLSVARNCVSDMGLTMEQIDYGVALGTAKREGTAVPEEPEDLEALSPMAKLMLLTIIKNAQDAF